MAFLALASQKSLLTLQKNFLQFQQVGIQNQIQLASAQMSAIQKEYRGCSSDESYEDDGIIFTTNSWMNNYKQKKIY